MHPSHYEYPPVLFLRGRVIFLEKAIMKAKDIFSILKETMKEWSEDNATRLVAALAYYTIFSIPPF